MTTIPKAALDAGAKALRASLDVNGGFVAFEDFPLVVGDIIAAALPHLTAPVQYRQREIDARLIAAAPDLLVTGKHLLLKLCEVYRMAGLDPKDCQAVRDFMAAAEKAEGGS